MSMIDHASVTEAFYFACLSRGVLSIFRSSSMNFSMIPAIAIDSSRVNLKSSSPLAFNFDRKSLIS